MSKIPILVCGRVPAVASGMRKDMLPEYDVMHICLDPAKAPAEVSHILSGGTPADNKDNLGSRVYSQIPVAVALGGGYTDEHFQAIKKVAEENKVAKKVVWLRADMSKATGPPKEGEYKAYAKQTADRLKAWLQTQSIEGKEGGDFYF